MLEILQKILIGVFGCALIFFPIAYRMMDKIRFHGQMCVRQMDGGLLRWLETASGLVALDADDPSAAGEYARIAEQYRKTRSGKTDEKIRLVNEAYEIVRRAAISSYGDARATRICAELDEIFADLSVLAGDYNANAKKFNEQLEAGFSGFLGKAFFFRPQPVLEDLTDLKTAP